DEDTILIDMRENPVSFDTENVWEFSLDFIPKNDFLVWEKIGEQKYATFIPGNITNNPFMFKDRYNKPILVASLYEHTQLASLNYLNNSVESSRKAAEAARETAEGTKCLVIATFLLVVVNIFLVIANFRLVRSETENTRRSNRFKRNI
ncbi:MAG: hypothetical protein J7L58_06640, partial [Thermoplasmata archaeon]|nr:hypothetical protein [Thermoplasmata archaeon]